MKVIANAIHIPKGVVSMNKQANAVDQRAGDVMCALENVIDPELGVDVVNLGIIYNVEIVNNTCEITMTLTHVWCPASDYLKVLIHRAAMSVDGIDNCTVKLVLEPKWTVDRMSRMARIAMNLE
ncbi:metal-sulfur cluster assembly factor [Companilactobacillus jidongensis]|uniref:metal-sulfur cluster assembly factor n=1 Tax=Companilactobacillus jidongensis TaxID=2486006 RepID=UPI001CDCAF97|nr:metal-sulfur cluster assembly factor [Companilactobacillus jidongensis]